MLTMDRLMQKRVFDPEVAIWLIQHYTELGDLVSATTLRGKLFQMTRKDKLVDRLQESRDEVKGIIWEWDYLFDNGYYELAIEKYRDWLGVLLGYPSLNDKDSQVAEIYKKLYLAEEKLNALNWYSSTILFFNQRIAELVEYSDPKIKIIKEAISRYAFLLVPRIK